MVEDNQILKKLKDKFPDKEFEIRFTQNSRDKRNCLFIDGQDVDMCWSVYTQHSSTSLDDAFFEALIYETEKTIKEM